MIQQRDINHFYIGGQRVLISHLLHLFVLIFVCSFFAACTSSDEDKEKAQKEELDRLATLGYLSGYREADLELKQTEADSTQMAEGYTLLTSGHAPEARLINERAETVFEWSCNFNKAFGNIPNFKKRRGDLTEYWRHVSLVPGAGLLAIFEGIGIIKLDQDSKLLWAKYNHAHHDLELDKTTGNIIVLTREARIQDGVPASFDYITTLNSVGDELAKLSVYDAITNSEYRELILGKSKIKGDFLHTNSIQILREDLTPFPAGVVAGDVLVSMRMPSALAIINMNNKKVVWAKRGRFREQHYAKVWPDHTLLLFDNIGGGKHSRVLRYTWPQFTLKEAIELDQADGSRFYSRKLGQVSQLSNGNLLIVESEAGRVFEVTPGKKKVWDYHNPHRTGEKKELIAVIPHAVRIPSSVANEFLQ